MKYSEFRQKVEKYPLFHSNIFHHLTDDVATLRRQITEWIAKGYIIKLKRGVYTLRDKDRIAQFSRYFLANQLYSPSYVSLESALSYYGIVPEGVYALTSVSTKKTQHFENKYGNFLYHHLKTNLFSDYFVKSDEFGNKFLIASKEKAIVDFLYLKTRGLKKFDENIFELSFRFQNLESVNKEKLITTASNYKQKKLIELVDCLIAYMET